MTRSLRILLIGNYAPMRQQSMLHFAELMRTLYSEAGHEVLLLQPVVALGRWSRNVTHGIGKWLGYIDRFLLFRFSLRRALVWADLVHICDQGNAMIVPWLGSKPHIVTCHDVLAIRAARGDIAKHRVRLTGRLLQRWIISGLCRARMVVCVSRQTAHELEQVLGLKVANVSVVANALNYPYKPMPRVEVAQCMRMIGLSLSQPYVLHVGGDTWYKNRTGVVHIFAELARLPGYQSHRLVLAGKAWSADLALAVAGSGLAGRIDAVIDPDNETLRALYSCADFLLFPSLAEGFGWPITEAMACGCPVATTGWAPMTEVGGVAALYLNDPTDAEGCARRIVDAMGEREQRIGLGFRQAARFNKAAMQSGYLGVIAQIVEGGC